MGNVPYQSATYICNASDQPIWARVEVDRVVLQHASAKFSVKTKDISMSGGGAVKLHLYSRVATETRFTRIFPGRFSALKPRTTQEIVYISIFVDSYDGEKEAIVMTHPLLLNDSVIVSAEKQMLLGMKGDLWTDADGHYHKH